MTHPKRTLTKVICQVPWYFRAFSWGVSSGNNMVGMAGISEACRKLGATEKWGASFPRAPHSSLSLLPGTSHSSAPFRQLLHPCNDISCHLLGTYHLLAPLFTFSKSILQPLQWGGGYCPHVTDKKTEAQNNFIVKTTLLPSGAGTQVYLLSAWRKKQQ